MSKSTQLSLYDRLEGSTWMDNRRYFACECPVETHSHSTKPLLVYMDAGVCLACSKTYSHDFLMSKIGNVSIRKPKKSYVLLPRWKQWEDKYGSLEEIAEYAYQNQKKVQATFYKKRELEDFVDKAKFGLLDGWATTPVFDRNGKVVDMVVRSIRQNNVRYVVMPHEDQTERPLYSPDWKKVEEADVLNICYGIYTVYSFEFLGLAGVTGISGKSLNAKALQPFKNKKIVIFPDYNEGRAAYKLAKDLGWQAEVRRISWDIGITDLDDIRRNYPKEYLERIVKGN